MDKKKVFIIVVVLLLVGAFFGYKMIYGGTVEEITKDFGESLDEGLGMAVPDFDGDVEEIIVDDSNIKEFDVIAKQWDFVPSTIEVNFGDTVIMNIDSVDVDHGIGIPEFGINNRLNAGEITTIEFVASKKGTFSFFCNVFCGSGHSAMDGKIIVN